MSDNIYEVPEKWTWTSLGSIGVISSGGTPSTKDEDNFNGDIPWITPADLSGYHLKFISNGSRNISKKGLNSSSAKLLPKDTILFSSRAPIGYVVIASNSIATNQGFKNVTVHQEIFNEYVYYYLKSSKELAEKMASGTTFLEISGTKFSQLPIPIPPLAEQHRIVAKIEELFTQLDAGVEALKKAKEELKQYRQAVLESAFNGKLSEEWRKSNNTGILSITVSIEQVHIGDKKIRRDVPDNVEIPEIFSNSYIPEKWGFFSIAELIRKGVIIDLKDGNHGANHPKTSDFSDNGLPFITAEHVHNEIDYYHAPKLNGGPLNKLKVGFSYVGDVILTHKGTIGRVAINKRDCVLSPQTTYYRVNENVLSNVFLSYALQSPIFQKQLSLVKSQTTRDFVSISKQYCLFIPIAPVEEQIIIINEIDTRFSVIEQIEKSIEIQITHAETLRQSILSQAFSGKLVPQDPNDEPAEKLLERIRAERNQATGKPINSGPKRARKQATLA